ncbi:MAG TPA: hypothetical protein PLK90_10755 [Clostridiales bacterium]|nr:hypothetical protein [Clostridiales bacterium]HQP70869.1 hypothetical protein [Clostridiales bacterium]
MKINKKVIMLKTGMAIMLLLLVFCAKAQTFKSGLDLIGKAEFHNLKKGDWDADKQTMNRYTDLRLRPWFNYEANKFISARFVFEIGDMAFGGDKGGTIGADKEIVELKNAYLDIAFTEKQSVAPIHDAKIRFGMQSHKDPHSLILEDDIAGLKYSGRYNAFFYDIAYYIPTDSGEKNINKDTYSFGTDLFNADIYYKINDNMTVGAYNLIKSDVSVHDAAADTLSAGYTDGGKDYVNKNSLYTWISPYFKGTFGIVSLDAMLSFNTRSAEYEAVGEDIEVDGNAESSLEDGVENGSGMALSFKSTVKATETLSMGVNFAYIGGDKDGVDFWQPYKNKYNNGTQMIGYGLNDKTTYNLINTGAHGIMLPTVAAKYKLSDTMAFGGAVGMAMTTEDVEFTDADGKDQKETYLGTEISLTGEFHVMEKLKVEPYFAIFMPGAASTKGADKEDSQLRAGLVANIKF